MYSYSERAECEPRFGVGSEQAFSALGFWSHPPSEGYWPRVFFTCKCASQRVWISVYLQFHAPRPRPRTSPHEIKGSNRFPYGVTNRTELSTVCNCGREATFTGIREAYVMRKIAYWTGKSVCLCQCQRQRWPQPQTSLHWPLPLTRKKLGYFTRLWVTAFFDV
jgi:hypothetical protein